MFEKLIFTLSGANVICGIYKDGSVNSTEFKKACDEGNRRCGNNPTCIRQGAFRLYCVLIHCMLGKPSIRDYITDTTPYQFCPSEFDLLVISTTYNYNDKYAYYWRGGYNVSGTYQRCLAYCTR